MNDRIQAWLKAKKDLERDPNAVDPDYVEEQNEELLEDAEKIFRSLIQN